MRFVKGLVLGTAITATAYVMYTEGMFNKKRMMKKARKIVNKIGMDC